MGRNAFALFTWFLAACSSSPPSVLEVPPEVPTDLTISSTDRVGSFEYRVGPGDRLRVGVFAHPELSANAATVLGTGKILLPLVGPVHVAGQSLEEVGASVEDSLGRFLKEPHVDVQVERFGSQLYLVFGEVAKPGNYPLERPITALEALARSGGLGPFANRAQVAWVRGGFREENLVLFDASQLDPVAMQRVRPGDVLFVGRRSWADLSEAARDVLPFMQTLALPLSIALQAATLNEVLTD